MKLSEAQQAELEKIREWACCFEPERRFMAEAKVTQLKAKLAKLNYVELPNESVSNVFEAYIAWKSKASQLESSLAEAREEIGLWMQRVTFVNAKRIAEAEIPDYGLAAYTLRDLSLTKKAELADLAHALHSGTASKGDWEGLRDLWDEVFRHALKEFVSRPTKEGEDGQSNRD